MESRVRPLCLYALVVLLSLAVMIPPQAHAFWGEDSLKTAGIITGITVGACLLIVLVAGTMIELKGEPDDVFSRLPIQNPAIQLSDLTQPQEQPLYLSDPLPCLGSGNPSLSNVSVPSASGPIASDDIVLLLADSRDLVPGLLQTQHWCPHPRRSSTARSRAVFLIDGNR